jgi:hypothetical protein
VDPPEDPKVCVVVGGRVCGGGGGGGWVGWVCGWGSGWVGGGPVGVLGVKWGGGVVGGGGILRGNPPQEPQVAFQHQITNNDSLQGFFRF